MGCGASSAHGVVMPHNIEEIMQIERSMPPYCMRDFKVGDTELDHIRSSWKKIADGETLPFAEAKQKDPNITAPVFFYDTFYNRLFEMHPETRALFKSSIQVQGRALFSMVAQLVSLVGKEEKSVSVKDALTGLASRHAGMQVKAAHYTFVGVVLLYTLSKCLGSDYTSAVESAWLNLYSMMMAAMIPTAVKAEVDAMRSADPKPVAPAPIVTKA